MICDGCKNELDGLLTEEMICPFCHKDISYLSKDYKPEDAAISSGNLNLRNEIADDDINVRQSAPLSALSFFVMQIIFIIPLINLIFLFLFSFKNKINENIRSFSRAILVWYAIFCTALLALVASLLVLRYPLDLFFWFTKFKEFINSIPDF